MFIRHVASCIVWFGMKGLVWVKEVWFERFGLGEGVWFR